MPGHSRRAPATGDPSGGNSPRISRPTISVVVPVYNGESFVGAAIDSIRRQTIPVDEIIGVDDGSTDGTARLLSSIPGVRLLRQANQGPPGARNLGISAAGGEMIAMLDADDLWPDDHLERLLSRFAEAPHLDVVLGRTQVVVADPPHLRPLGEPTTALLLGSALFRRSVFDRIGLFETSLRLGDDTDWFLRAMEEGAIEAIEAVTLVYRLHTTNLTLDRATLERGFVATLKRSLDRRRARGGGTAADLPPLPGARAGDSVLQQTIDLRRRIARVRAARADPHGRIPE